MEDPAESTKRLEQHVKRISNVVVADEPAPGGATAQANTMVSVGVLYASLMDGRWEYIGRYVSEHCGASAVVQSSVVCTAVRTLRICGSLRPLVGSTYDAAAAVLHFAAVLM